MSDLAARIQRLEDIEALRTLRNAYHACINDGRYAEIADLCTDDAVVHLGYLARYEGRAAIDAGFRAMGQRERFFIKQFIHSHEVNVDGDAGTGVSYLEARYGALGVSYWCPAAMTTCMRARRPAGSPGRCSSISTLHRPPRRRLDGG